MRTVFLLICVIFKLIFLPVYSNETDQKEEEEKPKQISQKELKSKPNDSKKEKGDEKETFEEKPDTDVTKKLEEPRISNKWYRGSFLIYDCSLGNYVCVNDISFEECQLQRKEDLDAQHVNLSCTPFKRFKTQELCFKYQYEKIHNQLPKSFCIHPKFR